MQNKNYSIARSHHEGDIFNFSHSKGRLYRLRRSTQYKFLAGEVLDTEFIPVYLSVIFLQLDGSAATCATTEEGHQAEAKFLLEWI